MNERTQENRQLIMAEFKIETKALILSEVSFHHTGRLPGWGGMKNLLGLAILGGKQSFCPQVGCEVGGSPADAPSTFTSESRAVLTAS